VSDRESGWAPGGTYLVTGGAGFIGSHLVHALVGAGRRVRVLDDFSTGHRENLAEVADELEVIEGDVSDAEACRGACEGVDYVLHEAAKVSVEASIEDPVSTHEVNALGTLKMLCAARGAGVRRFVYAGSASAYGNPEELPHREEMTPQPLSPYAVAKHAGELYCRVFSDLCGLETVVLRYFNVFGPRQDASSPYSGVIAIFAERLLRGGAITIEGDGEQSRDFVPVRNVVAANLRACTAPAAPGKVLNIGCGESMTINQLAAALRELTGSSADVSHGPPRQGDVRHSVADVTRAREILGYEPEVSVLDGLRETVAWYGGSA
jgi:UDP-N-acetylglucosamine 4-epimerase